jgi:hypothetical protein
MSDSLVKYLLTGPKTYFNDVELCGQTLLLMAVILREQGIVEDLLNKKEEPNIRDAEEKTPPMRATATPKAQLTNQGIMEALVKGRRRSLA